MAALDRLAQALSTVASASPQLRSKQGRAEGRGISAMQRLILLRHGKAESTAATGGDFERGLTESGRREAALIGHALARTGCTPDLVLVSTARRAMETWEAAQAAFPKARMAPARELYHASADALAEAIDAAGGPIATPMIVGHNPVI